MRILDLTDELGRQGARLLVGLGADVLRVDDGGGLPPAGALHWHAGKRRLRLPDGPDGERALDELAAGADVVLESGPVARLRGLTADGSSRWPGAVHVVVTPFGLTGPRRGWLADDLVLASAGGMTWLGGRADGQPKPPPAEQAVQLAGAHAALGALLGLLARDRTGRGQLVDVSGQEAVAATLETGAVAWIHAGSYPVRNGGVYQHVAHRIFAAADGYVAGGYSGSERMWTDLLAWLVEESAAEDLTDPRYADPVLRWAERPHVDEVVARFAAARDAAKLAAEGRRRALPWAEVATPEGLAANPQLREREFFVTVTGEGLPEGGVRDVGFPSDAPGLPRPVTLPAMRTTTSGWTRPARRGAPATGATDGGAADGGAADGGAADSGALAGLRVLDLTWVLAGPYATKTLADHGADIIKIESRHRGDPTRFAPAMRLRPGAGPDDSGYFLNFNRGKRSVALNLRTEQGREVLRELAGHCDVLVENFSPGVLARWGMDYATLRERHPEIIVVSMAGAGQTGPWRDAVTFADTLAAMSGLSYLTRDPGGPPQGLTFGLGDMVAANAAVLATLNLLAEGRGGLVDLSQLEAMAATMGPALLAGDLPDALPDARTPAHPNRDARMVPHGVYPAAGEDRWVAIAVPDDVSWRRLVDLAGLDLRPDADLAARRALQDRIDTALAGWTATHEPAELAARLQAAGIAAAPVATGADLVDGDEHLASRGFYPVLEHPIAGPVRHEGIVARLADTPGRLRMPAPLLGEHTAEVLTELLGYDADRLTELTKAGALE